MPIIDYASLFEYAHDDEFRVFLDTIPPLIEKNFNIERSSDLLGWLDALQKLPDITPSSISLDSEAIRVGSSSDCTVEIAAALKDQLKRLHPWRKGPFDLFGTHIDTEWRSDWKWDRLKNRINSLNGKRVLDVGCGSGYHCWRMRGAGARLVIGIEPTLLFIVQFHALQKYIRDSAVHVLPARLEELPLLVPVFDSTFSMGVLYHRRSPFDHLLELKNTLTPGGQLILETLVIDGKRGEVLVPTGRYGKMGNVWFIPSVDTLCGWLEKIGFVDVNCIDINKTTNGEQRTTEWMTFQSFSDFLDPLDKEKTVEGYPAPQRGIFIANKPL